MKFKFFDKPADVKSRKMPTSSRLLMGESFVVNDKGCPKNILSINFHTNGNYRFWIEVWAAGHYVRVDQKVMGMLAYPVLLNSAMRALGEFVECSSSGSLDERAMVNALIEAQGYDPKNVLNVCHTTRR